MSLFSGVIGRSSNNYEAIVIKSGAIIKGNYRYLQGARVEQQQRNCFLHHAQSE